MVLVLMLMPSGNQSKAQLAPGGTTISITPLDVRPEAEFTARVEAYAYDITRARISWHIDGVHVEAHDGMRTITQRAPSVGDTLTIAVRVTEPSGTVHTAETTLVGNTIDIIIESDTRIPSFYRGRALPSPGSIIRAVALPVLFNADGSRVTENIVYTWRIGGAVAQSTGNSVTAEMPRSGPLLVEVTAQTRDGNVSHRAGMRVEPVRPIGLFYEDNPLYGLAREALPKEFTLVDDEISVRAEPYFVASSIFERAHHAWTINGTVIENPNADPQTLTLRGAGRGSSRVAFSIRNLQALQQAAQGSFRIHFGN